MTVTSEPVVVHAPLARRRRRLLVALAVCAAAGLTFAGLGVIYVTVRLGAIRRVSVSGLHPVGPGSPQTILVAGSDSRAGITGSQAQHFGSAADVTGQRSDVIVLIHINPGTGKAAMLSIPRDMFVPIAGTSSSNRINVAFANGPSQLVKTIQQDFGITINHYAQEDFSGLQGITDAVGGVCMNFPYPVRDGSPTGQGNESGLNIPLAGKHTLKGAEGLAFVRSRYYQYFANGTWHAEGTGDIGRIQRQHEFMRALAARALHASLRNPLTANAVMSRATPKLTIDSSFTSIGLVRLAMRLRSIKPTGMPSWTLPYHAVTNSFGDVLMPDQAQGAAVISAWMSYGSSGSGSAPTAVTLSPSAVTVQVLNGSGIAGKASTTASELRRAGFQVSGIGTASATKSTAVITYGSGGSAAAHTVAAQVRGPVSVVQDTHLGGTVVLTIGTSFGGIGAASPPATSAAASAPATNPPWDPSPC